MKPERLKELREIAKVADGGRPIMDELLAEIDRLGALEEAMGDQVEISTDAEKVKQVQQFCLNYLSDTRAVEKVTGHSNTRIFASHVCYAMLELTLDCSKIRYPADGGMPTYYDADGNEIDLEKLRAELNS